MLAIEEGNDEMERRGEEEGFIADVLWILKAEQSLPRHLNGKDIDASEFWKIHWTARLSSGSDV